MIRRAAAALLLVLAACGDDGGTTCPNDLPSACPSPTPSYQAEVEGIVQTRCFPCHTSGGVADAAHDFSSYAHVAAQKDPMLHQVYACKMPPPEAPAPTSDERAALLAWLVCGAPDN